MSKSGLVVPDEIKASYVVWKSTRNNIFFFTWMIVEGLSVFQVGKQYTTPAVGAEQTNDYTCVNRKFENGVRVYSILSLSLTSTGVLVIPIYSVSFRHSVPISTIGK